MKNAHQVVITGGAGYIGSHVANRLLEAGYRVVIIDNFSHGFRGAIAALRDQWGDAVKFVQGDITVASDLDKAIMREKVDGIFHFAALCSVDESMRDPATYFFQNTFATYQVLEAMRRHHIPKLIFSSTCAVYGNAEYLPVDEKHPTHPTNPYGESKLMAEKMIEWYERAYGIRYVILRYFNVCGAHPMGMLGDSKKPSVLLVQNAVRGAMGIEPFQCTYADVQTPDGSPIRDYIHVEDIAMAHVLGYEYLLNGDNQSVVANVGSEKGYSVKEILDEVEKALGVRLERGMSKERRKGEYARIFANISVAKEVLGFIPQKTLRECIIDLQTWYAKHPNGWEV